MIATLRPSAIPLGASVPALTAHAISVSLPTWDDNVGYEEGDKRVVDKMETGYPRFFIHRSIQKLATLCLDKFGRADESCMLFPSPTVAAEARDFLASQNPPQASRIVEFVICPSTASLPSTPLIGSPSSSKLTGSGIDIVELQIVLFEESFWSTAKAFWQHTGDGICSRMADRALAFLGETPAGTPAETASPVQDKRPSKILVNTKNRHYSRQSLSSTSQSPITPSSMNAPSTVDEPVSEEVLTADLTTYLEERYGRNLPMFNAPLAKQALKRRIAGGLLPSDEGFGQVEDVSRGAGNGRKGVSEEDIYLFPGGMSAIWHSFDICRKARRAAGQAEGKSVMYGFPYIDTLKILQRWGPGCHFFGSGGSDDIPALERTLASHDPSEPPILALFCEFPGNPLLRSPDLVRIRQLADEYGFVVVVDETVGNFINVEVMAFADIVVSSLTKIFSGDANVMGGSLIVNPNSAHYASLKDVLRSTYEDNYYPEDAVYMERNSRDYRARIKWVNDNAFDVTAYLHSRSLEDTSSPSKGKAIKKVYYPRYSTPETYEQARRQPALGRGGYGGLFSLTFTSLAASKAFYDALGCAKGPSLGTSFTLASPYTILAHYTELDWAAKYGVEAGLVRISVGQEDEETLREWFETSVTAAEAAAKVEPGHLHESSAIRYVEST